MCILILSEKRGCMDEQSFRDFLEEYFEGNFELLSFIKRETCSCDINFSCNISNEEGVNRFLDFCMKETNETIKLKHKKMYKQRTIFNVKATDRCHYDTQYEGSSEVDTVLNENLFKRFRNTNCPFQMMFKVLKDKVNNFYCNVFIEHCHNHAVNSLEALRCFLQKLRWKLKHYFLLL